MIDMGSSSELPSRWHVLERAFAVCAVGTGIFAICMMGVTPSFAQNDPGPVTSPVQTVPSPALPENAPHTEELGMPLGSFRLYPTLDLRAGYDSNVFAQPAGQQVSSAYEAIRPSLDLRSDWSNHMLNFNAYGAFGFYNNASTQNYQNFGVLTDGRFDIQRDWYLTASGGFARTTEALGTPDVAFAQSPTVVNTIPVNLAMFQRFNRLFYQASASLTRYSYQDNSTISTQTLPSGSRDRTEYGENLRAGYEIRDGWDIWAQGGLNQRRYLQQFNTASQQRDSNGWTITGGSTLDLGGVSKLEGFVGYSQQTYINPGLTTPAVVFGLAGVWNGYEPLVVRPFVIRAINETAYTNYQDYLSTTIGSEFLYTLTSDWTLNAGASFSLLNYTPVPGTTSGAFQHTDNFFRASLGALYTVFPQLQIGPLYEFAAGNGPDPATSPNYNRHIIMLRIVARR
jgi:Putative beta-barrel porin 2